MTSHDRVEAAYNHVEADRVPALFKNDEPPLTAALIDATGASSRDDMLDRLGIDIRIETPPYTGPPLPDTDDGRQVTHWGTIGGTYTQTDPRPLAHVRSLGDLAGWQPPSPDWFDYDAFARNCAHWTGRAVMAASWEPLFCGLCDLVGMEKGLMMLASDPPLADAIVDIVHNFSIEKVRRSLAAAGDRVQICYWGDDFATDKALMMGYDCWKRFFRKPMARIIAAIRDAGVHAHVHCCGAMAELLPDFIDMGVESIEPCQFHLPAMDPVRLKREFGHHLVFFGGVDSQHVLPFGSPDDVRRETRSRIDVVGKAGGYVSGSDHSLLADIPPHNVLAMYREIGSFRPRYDNSG